MKGKISCSHPPFPEQSVSLFISGKCLYILVNHGRESTAVLLIEITTHVVGSNRWDQQVVPTLLREAVVPSYLHPQARDVGPPLLVICAVCYFSPPSKSMVELHFPTYLSEMRTCDLFRSLKHELGIPCQSGG